MGSDIRHSDPSLRCPEDNASCALAGLSDGIISFPLMAAGKEAYRVEKSTANFH